MKYVKFGNAGVEVSAMCLGAMTFYERNDEETSIGIVRRAHEVGVNFIDTADSYGRGKSEEFLGRALEGIRQDIFLATKFYVPYTPTRRLGGGLACSRKHIVRYVEDSLRRLQTDYIDLIQLHHPNPKVSVEETLSALDLLVKQGKVLYVGVSNHYAWQMAHLLGVSALHGWEPLISIQARYNLLDRAVEIETVPFCRRFNIAMMAYSPQDGGTLTGKYHRGEAPPEGSRAATMKWFADRLTDETFDVVEKFEEIAKRNELGLNQLAVLWLMQKDFCCVPIIGGSKPQHFESLYEVADRTLSAEDLKTMDELTAQCRFVPFGNQPMVDGSSPALNWW